MSLMEFKVPSRIAGSLALLLLIGNMISPLVSGDGFTIATAEIYAGLRENHQLAFIDVHEEYQDMELFINIVSLDPGNNITLVIPLRTQAESFEVENMTDNEFKRSRRMDHIPALGERQTEGFDRLMNRLTDEGAKDVASFMLKGGVIDSLGDLGMTLGFTSDKDEVEYSEDGFSVDLKTFRSEESLKQFFDNLNMTIPDHIRDTVQRYSNYSLAIVNFTTAPPIPEEEFTVLQTTAPSALSAFKSYVRENDRLVVHKRSLQKDDLRNIIMSGHGGGGNGSLSMIYNDLSRELSSYMKDHPELPPRWDEEVLDTFVNLVAATYGIGDLDGYALQFRLPLFEGKAFFPLGTTPTWNGINEVRVIFACDRDRSIEFEHDPDFEAFEWDRHYYIWNFGSEAPDFDLEGDPHSDGNFWKWILGVMFNVLHGYALLISYALYLGCIAVVLKVTLKRFSKQLDITHPPNQVSLMILFLLASSFLLPLPLLMVGLMLGLVRRQMGKLTGEKGIIGGTDEHAKHFKDENHPDLKAHDIADGPHVKDAREGMMGGEFFPRLLVGVIGIISFPFIMFGLEGITGQYIFGDVCFYFIMLFPLWVILALYWAQIPGSGEVSTAHPHSEHLPVPTLMQRLILLRDSILLTFLFVSSVILGYVIEEEGFAPGFYVLILLFFTMMVIMNILVLGFEMKLIQTSPSHKSS